MQCLAQVLGQVLRHVEHGHLALTTEYGFEFGIRVDHTLVGFVLQLVGFDVNPDLLHHFGAGHGLASDYSGQVGAWCQGFHEGSRGFAG